MRVLLRILGFLKAHKKLVVAAYIAMIGQTLLFMAMPRLLGESIDRVLEQGSSSFLLYAGLAIVAIAILRGAFSFYEHYLRESLAQHVAYDVRNVLFDRLQGMSFAYHDRQQTGQLMARATADVENIRWFVSLGVMRMSFLLFMTLTVSAILLTLNWKLALLSMAFVPFIAIRGVIIGRQLRHIWGARPAANGGAGHRSSGEH